MRREFIIPIHDFLIDSKRIVIVEGRVACKHLEYEHAKSPPIDVLVVTFRLDNFWSQILRSATKRVRFVLHFFSETEICNLHMTLLVDQ